VKSALITGITGQDGSYLADLLLEKGYRVFGMTRRSSTNPSWRVEHLIGKVEFLSGDLLDQASLLDAVAAAEPDEVYNLAAQSFVKTSWNQPVLTSEFTGIGVTRMLEAVRREAPDARFYQASSSEIFGRVQTVPQNESTPFYPRSPYGVAKLYGHWITINYRESFDMHCSSGILFNHDSPRRGLEFVTRKISYQAALIHHGLAKDLALGNLEARRDWGHAKDYVEAMWLMLQQEEPGDYVIATGETHSVADFAAAAFDCVGLNWEDYVRVDPKFYRPAEVDALQGDATRALERFGWRPKVSFPELVREMVEADVALIARRRGQGDGDVLRVSSF
jgi:GDPmannose 4,6-dehydratase